MLVCALLADAFEARHADVDAGSATVGQKAAKETEKNRNKQTQNKKKEKSK
jgi:hypothetical protein